MQQSQKSTKSSKSTSTASESSSGAQASSGGGGGSVIATVLLVLLLLLIIVLIILIIIAIVRKNNSLPCPLLISYPGDKYRSTVESFIKSYQADFPDSGIQSYDPHRDYIIFTKYYINNNNYGPLPPLPPSPIPLPKGVVDLIKNSPEVPIGYTVNKMIYTLKGVEVWPDIGSSSS